jgi:LacI family transcriptional regulator
MQDVARLAGVSVATVSAVINGTATVSAKRSERVREAMAAIDYSPDQIARSLRVGRSGVIGMVIPDVTNAFFPEVIRGVEDSARQEGYSVILCNSNEDPEQEERHLNMLASRRVDGVLLACTNYAAAYDRLLRRRFPIVFFDRIPEVAHHGAVGTDNLDGSYQATLHLIEQGHRDIAFIAGNLLLSPHAKRLEGFRKAMGEAKIPVHDQYLRFGNLQLESGYQNGLQLLSLSNRPTAIISSSSKMLLGLLRAMRELDVRCPAQVSVIGFDDHVWSEFFHPPLTCVSQPSYDIGQRAFQMLLRRLQKDHEPTQMENQIVLLKAQLRVRESTAPPAASRRSADGSSKRMVETRR